MTAFHYFCQRSQNIHKQPTLKKESGGKKTMNAQYEVFKVS